MQTAIYDPHLRATPTQIEDARNKRERDQRVAEAAERLAQSKVVAIAPPVVPAARPEIAVDEWVERQLALAPMKPTWFSIIEEMPRRPRIEEIQRETIAEFRVSMSEFFSERRHASVVLPRQVAMFLSKTLTIRSLPEIGRRFGGRDHTTVLHAVRKIERLLPADSELQASIERIKQKLGVENDQ